MPLLWKKRSQKTSVPNELCTVQTEEKLPEILSNCYNEIRISFVTQDFCASLHDEISVRRGQVIQPLYTDDNMWLFICNVDGQCGYIPASVSCSINNIESITGWSSNPPTNRKPKVKPLVRALPQNVVLSRLNSSSAFPYNNLPTSPNLTHIKEGNRNMQCTADALPITELSSSPHMITKLHPLHPLSLCNSSSGRNTHNSIITHRQDNIPAPVPHIHARTQSYQEAITAPQSEEMVLSDVAMERPMRPCDLPIHPAVIYDNNGCSLTTTTTEIRTYNNINSSQYDDVFLPSNKKPFGIFKTLSMYEKTVPGEVSVLQGEYVIVTELGQGEWAWITTASGAEGVIPKDILIQYDPLEFGKTIGTQTELMIVAPSSTIIGRPAPLSNYSRRVSSMNQCSSLVAEVAVQTDTYSPIVMDVWSRSQTIDDLWYENSISLPRLNGMSFNGIDSPSICTLPAVNGLHDPGLSRAFHSSRQSLPTLALNGNKKINSSDQSERPVVSHRLVDGASDSPGMVSNCSDIVAEIQTVVLKATQSYMANTTQESHYLSLKKGDILHVSPDSNTMSQGWIWVYHVQKGIHGFVPKSHTAFLCITKHGGINRFDEV